MAVADMIEANTVHGYARRGQQHPLYHRWKNIKQWCTNSNNDRFHCYGGRGILMCERWQDSFPDFMADVLAEAGERPSKAHSLDRVDKDSHWQPGNIRYATAKQQHANSRCGSPETLAKIAATLRGMKRTGQALANIRAACVVRDARIRAAKQAAAAQQHSQTTTLAAVAAT